MLLGEIQPGGASGGGGAAGPSIGQRAGQAAVGDDDFDYSIPPGPDPPVPSPSSPDISINDPDPGIGGGTGPAPTSTVTVAYTWGEAGLISERFSPGQSGAYSYWYHFGPQGETRYLSNSSGIPTHPYVYTAYGVQLATLNATNPFKYGGQAGYYTSGVATSTYQPLILCGARWYDTELGRFLSRDPIGYSGGPNLFEYCGSNPIGFIDPLGLDFLGLRNGSWYGIIAGGATFLVSGNLPLAMAAGFGTAGYFNARADGSSVGGALVNAGVQGALGYAGGSVLKGGLTAGLSFARSYGAFRAAGAGVFAAGAFAANHPELGQEVATGASAEVSQCVTVSRWGRPGLQPGDWVVRGPANFWSYFKSFKWDPGPWNRFAPPGAGEEFEVPASSVKWPTGLGIDGFWKGFFGQRMYLP